jgi:vancomycin resistance protein YoaR
VRGRVAAAVVAATLGVAAVAVGSVVLARSGTALPGTSVAGVDVGGQDRDGIRTAVSELAAQRTEGSLPVRAGDVEASIDRSLARVDVEQTVDEALSAGRGGLMRVLGPLLASGGRGVALALDVDEVALRAELDGVGAQLDREPDPGGFTVDGTTVVPRQPEIGRTLDRVEAVDAVEDAIREGRTRPLPLPVDERRPPTTPQDVDRVVAQARRALEGPFALTRGDQALQVTPQEIAPMLLSRVAGGELEMAVDLPALNDLVATKAQQVDRPPRSAGFDVAGSPPRVDDKDDLTWTPLPAEVRVRPSASGLEVDVDPATARLSELISAGERDLQRALPVRTTMPPLTTQDATSAGVRDLIGTFTTYFQSGQPRATNIRRMAEIVDGTYVAAGETLSLNDTAGRRTRARGFVADGAIVDGELVDEVGGGVSQFATTLFNAAFFAGLPIPEHQPHSFYISRYPAGRESTVYFGAIDVKVRNDTGNGIWLETGSTRSSVTVALYGDNGGRRVTASHGPRMPQPDGGFGIRVTRTITGGDGQGGRRVFTTSYDPPPEEDD